MTTINADMTDSQLFVPLSEADALATVPGYYTIGSENLELSVVHMDDGVSQPSDDNRPNGRTCIRHIGGSTAATHTSGATLTRYYPDAPGGGGIPTLAEVLVAGNDPGANLIQAAADGAATGANLQVAAGSGSNGGDVTYVAGIGAGGGSGAHIYTSGGQDADGGDIVIAAGDGVNGGKVTINGGYSDEDGALVVIKGATLTTPGYIFLNLPTSDPAVAGALWNNAGTVKVSAG